MNDKPQRPKKQRQYKSRSQRIYKGMTAWFGYIMTDVYWAIAKVGFALIKPWIYDQYVIDGDLTQVQEIFEEVAQDAIKEIL